MGLYDLNFYEKTDILHFPDDIEMMYILIKDYLNLVNWKFHLLLCCVLSSIQFQNTRKQQTDYLIW